MTLVKINEEISKSGIRGGRIIWEFNEEFQKSEPRKSALKIIWNVIEKAMSKIVKIVDVIYKILKLFTGWSLYACLIFFLCLPFL